MTVSSSKLGALVAISKGRKHEGIRKSASNGWRRYIQIEDLRNNDSMKFTAEAGVEALTNDVIIAWDGANAGTIGFGLDGFIGSTLARLRIKDPRLDPSYLGWFLRGKSKRIRRECYGATIPHVSKPLLESIDVPLPPLPVQKRIAAILEKADAAREKRRQANALTDQFLQSAFLEMFGDPVTNPKGWMRKPLMELCARDNDVRCGPFGSQLKKEHYQPHGVPVWDIEDVKSEFANSPRFFVSEARAKELSNYCLGSGDVVVTRRATIGLSAVYPESAGSGLMHSALLRIRPDLGKVEPIFLSFQLSNSKDVERQISHFSSGAIFQSINVAKLKAVGLILPPLSQQRNYGSLVEKIGELKLKQRMNGIELRKLFDCLSEKAFGGELVA